MKRKTPQSENKRQIRKLAFNVFQGRFSGNGVSKKPKSENNQQIKKISDSDLRTSLLSRAVNMNLNTGGSLLGFSSD